jgi:hypothetical protein
MMSGRALVGVLVAVVLAAGSVASVARADGDPGSDVLVYQDLFAGSSAGLSVQQQARLGDLLKAASAARFPIRVAIIASPTDLGAVTALWREPRSYARFLGLELSLAYKQRLLVVMPKRVRVQLARSLDHGGLRHARQDPAGIGRRPVRCSAGGGAGARAAQRCQARNPDACRRGRGRRD